MTPNAYELSLIERFLKSEEELIAKNRVEHRWDPVDLYEIEEPSGPMTGPQRQCISLFDILSFYHLVVSVLFRVVNLARQFGVPRPTIFLKSDVDIITDGNTVILSRIAGSIRRCGNVQKYIDNKSHMVIV